MFGDDPDRTVTTARVGSGEVSDEHVRGRCTVQRGVFGPSDRIEWLGTRRGVGGWTRWAVARLRGEKRERDGPTAVFGDRKRPMLDRL